MDWTKKQGRLLLQAILVYGCLKGEVVRGMSKVEVIEEQIEKLSPDELATFRRWYAAFDAETWDRQFEVG